MNPKTDTPGLKLKKTKGWFAAGNSFKGALCTLSDGSFKLFAYLCLESDRRTGRFKATQKEIAAILHKSKRSIATYIAELEKSKICVVLQGRNQFTPTVIEIADSYWPYEREEIRSTLEDNPYVETIREFFLSLGCISGNFGAAEVQLARDMERRSIPLSVIQEAMLLGACRKYDSWIGGSLTEGIQSFAYFEPLVAEILDKPFPPGYDAYLRKKIRQLGAIWKDAKKPADKQPDGK